MKLKGIAVSPGIGIGRLICISDRVYDGGKVEADPAQQLAHVCEDSRAEADPAQQLKKLAEAAARFTNQTECLIERIRKCAGESEAEILEGQIMIIEDPEIKEEIESLVNSGCSAENAVDSVLGRMAAVFEALDDELIRQRAADIRDARDRMCEILQSLDKQSALASIEALEAEQAGEILLSLDGQSIPVDDSLFDRLSCEPKGMCSGEIADLAQDNSPEAACDTILIAKEFTPSMTAALNPEKIVAIAAESGGRNSHAAILARALGIPAVLGVPNLMQLVYRSVREEVQSQIPDREDDSEKRIQSCHTDEESELQIPDREDDSEKRIQSCHTDEESESTLCAAIVNGISGEVILNPTQEELREAKAEAERCRREEEKNQAGLSDFSRRPTVDAEGNPHPIYANIRSLEDLPAAIEAGAEGIGLFRTEFLYMNRETPPTEEEQVSVYEQVAAALSPVIIRTLDAGGDKQIPCLKLPEEENPFLGTRGIRFCLTHPEVFKTQLRALLRAAGKFTNIRIMLPMVTDVQEIRLTRQLMETCKEELRREGLPCEEQVPLGIMIETPAAVLTADLLAGESDFFSIGSNDLTQYILAVDRGRDPYAAAGNEESVFRTNHPAVLRAIELTVRAAKEQKIPVGICGEDAADPDLLPVWIRYGLDELSMEAAVILPTRAQIAKLV